MSSLPSFQGLTVRPHSHDGPPAHQLGPQGFSIPLHLPSEVGYARVSSEALHHSGTDTGWKAESPPPPWQRPGQGRDQTGPRGDLTSIHSQAAVTMYCHRWASTIEICCAQFCRWEVQNQVSAGLVPSGDCERRKSAPVLSPGPANGRPPCVSSHHLPSMCVCIQIFPFYKNTSHPG